MSLGIGWCTLYKLPFFFPLLSLSVVEGVKKKKKKKKKRKMVSFVGGGDFFSPYLVVYGGEMK